MAEADIHFYFDPVCPFAWMTSKWVRLVMAQRNYRVDWRFISLRMVNASVDYDTHFPPGYESGRNCSDARPPVPAGIRAERAQIQHGARGVL
jgi:predicted DsbA family dithiol-disulfide isomerase